MAGWIKLHRQLLDSDLWKCEPFTRGQAWVDLILLANHQDSFFYKRGVKIDVKRGQVGRSEVELSDRWSWSRNKVRKFLNDLEKEQQIEQQKTNVTQLLTIINYDIYQEKDSKQNTRKTAEGQQKDTYKKEEKNKELKEIDNTIPAYEDFEKYALEVEGKLNFEIDLDQLKLKYESWNENNWHTGGKNSRAIKNWKTTLLNTFKYIKKEKSFEQKEKKTASQVWREKLAGHGNN